jgi:hypothetical protein
MSNEQSLNGDLHRTNRLHHRHHHETEFFMAHM